MKRTFNDHVTEPCHNLSLMTLPKDILYIILCHTTPSCRAVLYYTSKPCRALINSATHLSISNKQKFIKDCAVHRSLPLLKWIVHLNFGMFPWSLSPSATFWSIIPTYGESTFLEEFMNIAILHNSMDILQWMFDQMSENTLVLYNQTLKGDLIFLNAITEKNYVVLDLCFEKTNIKGRYLEMFLSLTTTQKAICDAGVDMYLYFIGKKDTLFPNYNALSTPEFKKMLLESAILKGNVKDVDFICTSWVFVEFEDPTQKSTDYVFVLNQAFTLNCKSLEVLDFLWNKLDKQVQERILSLNSIENVDPAIMIANQGVILLWFLKHNFNTKTSITLAVNTGNIEFLDFLYKTKPVVEFKVLQTAYGLKFTHVAKWALQKGITYSNEDLAWIKDNMDVMFNIAMWCNNMSFWEWLATIFEKNTNDPLIVNTEDDSMKVIRYIYSNISYNIGVNIFLPPFFDTTYKENPNFFEFLMKMKKKELMDKCVNGDTTKALEDFFEFCLTIAERNYPKDSTISYLDWLTKQGYTWGKKDHKLLRQYLESETYLEVAQWLIQHGVDQVSIPTNTTNLNINYFPLSSRRMIRAYNVSLIVVLNPKKR